MYKIIICSYCFHLVASSHLQSHQGKCPLKPASTGVQLSQDSPSNTDATTQLPSFEDVCLLHCSTIRHIPIKSRPAFAGVLSAAFHSILHENSEEAWLKFFMLPKWLPNGGDVTTSLSPSTTYVINGPKASLDFYGSMHLSK